MRFLLPTWTYRNNEFLEMEKELLFKPNWLLVGHISELSAPGSAITFDGLGERAMVIKDHDGVIRAFHNICRHRGAPLLEPGSQSCPRFLSCPFHGWTYDLQGKLIAVPAKDSFDGLKLTDHGLVSIEHEIWMGLIFIRFVSGGEPLHKTLSPVAHLIEPYQVEKMQPLGGTDYREVRPYNWKIIHDIDNEGYHVPVGHPSLQQLYGSQYVDTTIDGIPVSTSYINEKLGKNWSVRHYQSLLPDFPSLPENNQRLWLYIGIFPNLIIGLYPESIEFYMTIPDKLDATIYCGRSYGLTDTRRETQAARYLSRRINNLTNDEDESFVRWIQEGMSSSAFPAQQLSTKESGVADFHEKIKAIIPIANQLDEPEYGTVRQSNQQLRN